jgi:hypothetical protein
VTGELGGGEQPGRASADDQNIVSRHSVSSKRTVWEGRLADPLLLF